MPNPNGDNDSWSSTLHGRASTGLDPEVQMIQLLVWGMKMLDAEQSERVIAYAQKLHADKHGQKKIWRERGGPSDR